MARKRPPLTIATDVDAENCAVGVAMILDYRQAHKMLAMLQGSMFWDQMNGWMWDELRQAVLAERLGLSHAGTFKAWMKRRKIQQTAKARWGKLSLLYAFGVGRCLDARQCWFNGFWWHWPWYVHRVKEAYRIRCEHARALAAVESSVLKTREFMREKAKLTTQPKSA